MAEVSLHSDREPIRRKFSGIRRQNSRDEGSKNPGEKAKQQVSLPILILSVVLLVAFLGWQIKINFFPPPIIAPLTPQERTERDAVIEAIQRAGGDAKKISPEDREMLRKRFGPTVGFAIGDVAKKDFHNGVYSPTGIYRRKTGWLGW